MPFSLAERAPTFVASSVVTAGGGSALKVRSAPALVPEAFVATSRKWYSVPGSSPEMDFDADLVDVPEPALVLDVFFP